MIKCNSNDYTNLFLVNFVYCVGVQMKFHQNIIIVYKIHHEGRFLNALGMDNQLVEIGFIENEGLR